MTPGQIVKDRRLAERRARTLRGAARRRLFVFLGLVGAGLVLAGSAWMVIVSGVLEIRRVSIEAPRGFPLASLSHRAQRYLGTSFFFFDQAGFEREILSDPLVGTVKVSRAFPSALVLRVTWAQAVVKLDPGPAGTSLAINSRWQAMPGRDPAGASLSICRGLGPYSGRVASLACAPTASLDEVSGELGLLWALRTDLARQHLAVGRAVVYPPYGVALNVEKSWIYVPADGNAARATRVISLLGAEGDLGARSFVDLTVIDRPVFG